MARQESEASWLRGDGQAVDRLRTLDWSATPLGPIASWGPPLRTAVNLLMAAPAPMFLFWGRELHWLYNDAAHPMVSAPERFGARGSQAQIAGWDAIEPDLLRAFAGLPAPAEAGWRLSQVSDDSANGGIGGILAYLGSADSARLLVESEARLRLGLEAGRMVTWEFDLTTGALTRSANSELIFGGGDKPQDYTSRMPAEDMAHDKLRLQRALAAEDGLYQSEFRYNHPDGRQLHLQNWGKIMRDAEGNPARVHGVCMDITDRKRAEHALKHLNETLEQEVRKRTGELVAAEEALRQSQRMEALGHLTGGVAHDFNNLLGAMVGSFDLIRRKADNPERVRSLAEAGLKVADRGTKLTSQLLTFSRGQRIELRAVRVADVLHGTQEMLERTLGPLTKLTFDIAPDERAVLSDATQLEMAVLNLVINARDAMPGGGAVTIATRLLPLARDPTLPPGDYIEVLVRDTGTGMSPDVAALAFDPFFTTKEVGKGTGLGLSQVYGIARQAGGTVRIDSAPGRGTTVRMLLPCTDTAMQIVRPAPARPPASPALEVLLVDDDVDLREVMAASLDDLGYRVIEAADGSTALMMLQQSAPDVLIVDFAMPGMTGAELAKAARARWPDLPIVFASGYADTEAIGDAAGRATRLLRKPFRIDELQRAITESLT